MKEKVYEKSIKVSKSSLKSNVGNKLKNASTKYMFGSTNFETKGIEHKKLRKTLEETKSKIKDAALRTATTEILLTSEPGFIEMDNHRKVYSLKQKDIVDNVDLNTAKNCMDLQLTNFGPYHVNYTRNGRYKCQI